MATTIERPQLAQAVAHATEYPADRDGDGTGYGRGRKNETLERVDADLPQADDGPAVLVEADHPINHALDGVAAYRAAAMQALEPGIDHEPMRPIPDSRNWQSPENVRSAYEDHGDENERHEVNVAT